MINKILGTLLLINFLWAIEIPIDEVKKHIFSETISVNSKIIQLPSSKSLVMAEMGGKITKYLVKEGSKVKKGQAVSLVSFSSSLESFMQRSLENSLKVAPLKAELKALRKRLTIANKNYALVRKLYDAGVESRQNMNRQEEEKITLVSEIEVLKVKLSTLKIKKKPKKSSYTLYAGNSGIIDKILVASNAVVDANTPLLSIVKGEESFLVQSYVPLKYVNEMKIGLKGKMFYGGKHHDMHLTQILPALDEQTQQIVVLFTLDKPINNLFVNTYVNAKLSLGIGKSYLTVKKTALNFFNNEWVVFIPKHHDEHEEEHSRHDNLSEETHGAHEGHDDIGHGAKEKKHDSHEGHGHEEYKEEVPYLAKVVKILKQNEQYVAIEGLEEHEDYVSDKAYHVKSLLLKSSLGGHGH